MLSERLGKVLASAALTQEEFADSVGMGLERLRNLLRGKVAKLRSDEARAIQQRWGWRESWLKDGKGAAKLSKEEAELLVGAAAPLPALQMVSTALSKRGILGIAQVDAAQRLSLAYAKRNDAEFESVLIDALESLATSGTPELGSAYIEVPRYDVRASAGGGAVIHDEAIVDHLAFRREWVVQQMGLDPKSLALITVRGDSMMGTIDHGDMVLLDVRPGQSYSDGIYIIQLSGALLCKRLHYTLSGMVEVLSDNPKYAKEVLRAEELERLTVVGRVVWHGRRI